MAKNDNRLMRDGWTSTLGGLDSSRAPNLLAPNQVAWVVNGTLRGGYIESRPPFVTRPLSYASSEHEEWIDTNLLQCARVYYPPENVAVLVMSVGGRLFTISPLEDFAVKEITPLKSSPLTSSFISPPQGTDITVNVTSSVGFEAGFPAYIGDGEYSIVSVNNNAVTLTNITATAGVNSVANTPLSYLDRNSLDRPQAWMEQAEEFLIVQDGLNAAILHDGSTTRRADAIINEVPTGTVMVYNEEIGRLCVCTKGNEIVIGDIVGNGTTFVFNFTETDYLSEGGKFRIPRKFGNVTGAAMMTNLDRSNGQGAMLFFAERGISAFNLPPTRELWKSLNYPAQVNMPIRYGAQSQDGVLSVNGDVFYRAKDGIRSFVMAIREFGKWGNVPLSREMDRALKPDDQWLLKFSSAALFDNRLLMTCSPRPHKGGAFHKGLVVLDFDLISSMGEGSRPVYDGLWTGLDVLKIVTGEFEGEERCFIFAKSANGGVELWELKKSGNFDGDDGQIQWSVESRAMDCGRQTELKRASQFELWIDRVAGEVTLDLDYKSDSAPCWADWDSKNVCQTVKACDQEVCGVPPGYRPGYRTRIGFGTPPANCESSDKKPMETGYEFQVKLNITGRARLKKAMLTCEQEPESTYSAC